MRIAIALLWIAPGCAITSIPPAPPAYVQTRVVRGATARAAPTPARDELHDPPDIVIHRASDPVDRHGQRRSVGRLGRWLDDGVEHRRQRWADRIDDGDDDDDDDDFDLFEFSTSTDDCR